MKLLLATNNKHKVKEMTEIFADMDYEIISPKDIGLVLDVDENGTTFAENATIKAKAFCEASGYAALADDSGLVVECLGGEPGVYSARYGGEGLDDAGRTQLLLKNMEGKTDRRAAFVCAIAMVFPDGRLLTSEGECRGNIAQKAYSSRGFGYDPVFVPEGFDKTFTELGAEIKNPISHRGRALAELKKKLEKLV